MGLAKQAPIKKTQIISLTLALIIFFTFSLLKFNQPTRIEWLSVKINGAEIKSESVYRPDDLYRGLSGRQSLAPNNGMLFNFNQSEIQYFFMKNMNFPLDIIFINDRQVVNIAKNLAPEGSDPKNIYSSGRPADQVLEINAGEAEVKNIKIGDPVTITKQ